MSAPMAPMIGSRLTATIISHGLRIIGDSEAARIEIQLGNGNSVSALIFLTEKSMRIARQQLRLCGFDPDSHDLQELESDRTLLAGTQITVEVDEYKGKLQYRIPTSDTPTKRRAATLTEMLRAAKAEGEEAVTVKRGAAPTTRELSRDVAQAVASKREESVRGRGEEPPPHGEEDIPF